MPVSLLLSNRENSIRERLTVSRRNTVAACLFIAASSMANANLGLRAADLTVRLAVGERDTIELIENPSTGYHWTIDTKASSRLSILRIVDLGLSRNAEPALFLDDPGYHRWNIEAISGGKAKIVFIARRRSSEGAPIRTHQVVIEATPR